MSQEKLPREARKMSFCFDSAQLSRMLRGMHHGQDVTIADYIIFSTASVIIAISTVLAFTM